MGKNKGDKEFRPVALLKNLQTINIVNGTILRLKKLGEATKINLSKLKEAKGAKKAELEASISKDNIQIKQLRQVLLSYEIPLGPELQFHPSKASVYLILKVSELKSLIKK